MPKLRVWTPPRNPSKTKFAILICFCMRQHRPERFNALRVGRQTDLLCRLSILIDNGPIDHPFGNRLCGLLCGSNLSQCDSPDRVARLLLMSVLCE
jgi:hypothetical protein